MTGMYKSRDIVSQGTINLGDQGSQDVRRGHIVSGRPVTPPVNVPMVLSPAPTKLRPRVSCVATGSNLKHRMYRLNYSNELITHTQILLKYNA